MAIDTSIPRSRRALLAGGIGGAAALAASALGRPSATLAGTDGDVVLGETNLATRTTTIQWKGGMSVVFAAVNSATGPCVAIAGSADNGTGVSGGTWTGVGVSGGAMGIGTGVQGRSGSRTGVYGVSGHSTNEPTTKPIAGVFGFCDSNGGRGVYGLTTSARGVQGQATTGVGGYFSATTGMALQAVGRVKLDKCAGVATIPATKSSVVVTPGIDLVSTSAVVATLQGSAGSATTTVSRCYVNVTTNTFTIYLTKAATQQVKVAWHVFG